LIDGNGIVGVTKKGGVFVTSIDKLKLTLSKGSARIT
jgi:hypothetical protein